MQDKNNPFEIIEWIVWLCAAIAFVFLLTPQADAAEFRLFYDGNDNITTTGSLRVSTTSVNVHSSPNAQRWDGTSTGGTLRFTQNFGSFTDWYVQYYVFYNATSTNNESGKGFFIDNGDLRISDATSFIDRVNGEIGPCSSFPGCVPSVQNLSGSSYNEIEYYSVSGEGKDVYDFWTNGVYVGRVDLSNPLGVLGDGTQMNWWTINTSGHRIDSIKILTDGDAPAADVVGTEITVINEPSTSYNTVTDSTTVDFDIDYTSSTPQPDRICINIDNLTVFQSLVPICEDIFVTGLSLNFSTSTVLIDGNQYRWSAVIYDSNNAILDEKGPYFFTVLTPPYTPFDPGGYDFGTTTPTGVSTSTTLEQLTLECDPSDGFFERSFCNLAVLLFVPSSQSVSQFTSNLNALLSKQPFSGFTEFIDAWNGATKNPDIVYTSLTLNFYGEEAPLISTTTLAAVAGNNAVDGLRSLMAIGLWVAFGWFVFIRVSKLF